MELKAKQLSVTTDFAERFWVNQDYSQEVLLNFLCSQFEGATFSKN